MNIAWDAANYADNFSFVPAYGKSVLELVTPGKGLAVGPAPFRRALRIKAMRLSG